MLNIHKEISIPNQRCFVIGDVHGNFDALSRLLENINYCQSSDTLISLGDLIDRGKQSSECLDFFIDKLNRYALRGNHEDMMCNAIANTFDEESYATQIWIRNGGLWALSGDFTEKQLMEWVDKISKYMHYTLTVILSSGTKFGLTHADYGPDSWNPSEINPTDKKALEKIIWSRDRANNLSSAKGIIKGADYTIHGHTKLKHPTIYYNSIFIDTAADYKHGELTAIELSAFAETNSLIDSTFSVPAFL